jgi:hypothetical protein
MSARILWVGLLVLGSACSSDVGVRVDEFKAAQSPAGIGSEVTLAKGVVDGNKIEGELIAVTDKSLVLLLREPLATPEGRRRFVEVPFGAMRRAKFEQLGMASVRSEGKDIDAARLDRLRRLSRFPQGLDEELQTRLFATYGEPGIYRLWRVEPAK